MAALERKRIKRHDPQAGYSIQVSNENQTTYSESEKKNISYSIEFIDLI